MVKATGPRDDISQPIWRELGYRILEGELYASFRFYTCYQDYRIVD